MSLASKRLKSDQNGYYESQSASGNADAFIGFAFRAGPFDFDYSKLTSQGTSSIV